VLTALKNFVYAGKRVVPGESFTVKGEDHAKALIGVGRAKPGAGMSVPPSRPAVGRRADSTPAPRSPKAADKPASKPAQPMRTPAKPGRPAQPPAQPKPQPRPEPRPEQPIVEPEPPPRPEQLPTEPDLPPQPTPLPTKEP
jgi:hypothetical protein